MSDVLIILYTLTVLILMGLTVYYRNRASKQAFERTKLKDSLELIDTKARLDAADDEVRNAEAKRIKATNDYRGNPWRPTDNDGSPR